MKFDEIGCWSEVKLEIVREYAAAYSKILAAQENPRLHHVYVDGFSGAGVHVAKRTGEFVKGSPLNALAIDPPFREYFLVDLDGDTVEHLRGLVGDRQARQVGFDFAGAEVEKAANAEVAEKVAVDIFARHRGRGC